MKYEIGQLYSVAWRYGLTENEVANILEWQRSLIEKKIGVPVEFKMVAFEDDGEVCVLTNRIVAA